MCYTTQEGMLQEEIHTNCMQFEMKIRVNLWKLVQKFVGVTFIEAEISVNQWK